VYALVLVASLSACSDRGRGQSPARSAEAARVVIDAHRAATLEKKAALEAIAALVRREPPATAPALEGLTEPLRLAHGPQDDPNATMLVEADLGNLLQASPDAHCRFRYDTSFDTPLRLATRGYTSRVWNDTERRLMERSFREAEAIDYVLVCRTQEYRLPTLSGDAVTQGRHRGDILVYDLRSRQLAAKLPFDIQTNLAPDVLRRKLEWFQGDRIDLGNAVFATITSALHIEVARAP
jgi:hypothetical protein